MPNYREQKYKSKLIKMKDKYTKEKFISGIDTISKELKYRFNDHEFDYTPITLDTADIIVMIGENVSTCNLLNEINDQQKWCRPGDMHNVIILEDLFICTAIENHLPLLSFEKTRDHISELYFLIKIERQYIGLKTFKWYDKPSSS